ncbi:MAG: hypothetical protein KBD06_03920 [Candidatus Pacebacteria bacterium]|nr:hypothetical protein [Candidatus Paceibacterota bacterium]
MSRRRTIFRESAVIVISGVVVALLITGVMRYMHTPTIADFQSEYSAGEFAERVVVAGRYLDSFSTQELNSAIEDQNAEGFCHSQAHALGRAVYKRYSNFSEAILQCGNSCTFGCFHGVLMEMFSTESDTLGGVIEEESPQQYLSHVESIAKDLCTRPDVQTAVKARHCYHGLGHVFEHLSADDLGAGLKACEIFENEYAATQCRSGVFMEYLLSSSSESILYTKGEEPCDAYPDFADKCYRFKAYGWIYAWGGIAPALAGCDAFGKNALLCIKNTAEATSTPLLLSSNEGIEKICGTLRGEKRSACIGGALTKIIDVNDGDDSERVCDEVASSYRDRCLAVREQFHAVNYLE